jgi:hypothetical protein
MAAVNEKIIRPKADTAGTTIANQVKNIYSGVGQLAFQYPGADIYSVPPLGRGCPHAWA